MVTLRKVITNPSCILDIPLFDIFVTMLGIALLILIFILIICLLKNEFF